MISQLCRACEGAHASATVVDVCPVGAGHLAEIQRLDHALALARLRIEELKDACRVMDYECRKQLVHAGEDNEAMAECISVLRARLAVVERERDSWESSCTTLRARLIKSAPEAEA